MFVKRLRKWIQSGWQLVTTSRRERSWQEIPTLRPYVEHLEERRLLTVSLGSKFTGLAYPDTQGYVPPDTNGAAGASKYVETVNQSLRLSNRDGSSPATSTFSNFFYTIGGLPRADSTSGLSDPIVVWDDQIQRFIVGDQDVNFTTHVSTFDIAVSKTASPS